MINRQCPSPRNFKTYKGNSINTSPVRRSSRQQLHRSPFYRTNTVGYILRLWLIDQLSQISPNLAFFYSLTQLPPLPKKLFLNSTSYSQLAIIGPTKSQEYFLGPTFPQYTTNMLAGWVELSTSQSLLFSNCKSRLAQKTILTASLPEMVTQDHYFLTFFICKLYSTYNNWLKHFY